MKHDTSVIFGHRTGGDASMRPTKADLASFLERMVIVHEGGFPASTSPYNGCVGISGPILDIVNNLDDEVDVVISGHTHQPYNCVIDNKIVTSAFSFGRLVTKIDLTIDRETGEVVTMAADNPS